MYSGIHDLGQALKKGREDIGRHGCVAEHFDSHALPQIGLTSTTRRTPGTIMLTRPQLSAKCHESPAPVSSRHPKPSNQPPAFMLSDRPRMVSLGRIHSLFHRDDDTATISIDQQGRRHPFPMLPN